MFNNNVKGVETREQRIMAVRFFYGPPSVCRTTSHSS